VRLLTDQEKGGVVRHKKIVGVEELAGVCVCVVGMSLHL